MKKKGKAAHHKRKKTEHAHTAKNLEHTLVQNLVALQKIHAELAEKFDKLSREISQILALFELAARSFAKKAPETELEKDREFLEKIDKLLEQNKVLAKGLTLMEERLRERMYGFTPQQETQHAQSQPPETQQRKQEGRAVEEGVNEFQPSMTSSGRPLPRF